MIRENLQTRLRTAKVVCETRSDWPSVDAIRDAIIELKVLKLEFDFMAQELHRARVRIEELAERGPEAAPPLVETVESPHNRDDTSGAAARAREGVDIYA